MQNLIKLAENGMMPDALIRLGIRRLCRERLESASKLGVDGVEDHHQKWVEKLLSSPIALVPDKANEQHYEVPPEFFEYVLGKNLKYSSGYWPEGVISLDQSEDSMLEHTFGRLEIEDGMDVLELGCGWGSLTCYMAERLPNSKIVAVSNSKDQREYINTRCKENGFDDSILDGISISFSADIDVKAKTKNGEIFLNQDILDEPAARLMSYLIHELTHVFQHIERFGKKDPYKDKEYLDRPDEIEAFKNQIEQDAEDRPKSKVNEYVKSLVEYHNVPKDEKESKIKELTEHIN